MGTVLVTGGSGFVGSHVVLQLLDAGHDVRTTVRSRAREEKVRAMLRGAGASDDALGRLTFHEADLGDDRGWVEAVRGVEHVHHVASPMPAAQPRDENELILPARDGALRVLRASRDAGVRRVVMTSSCGAVYYGHPDRTEPFDETSWTDAESPEITSYVKSKTVAERAAWDFVANEGGGLELSVTNPVGIFGPVLAADTSSSIELVATLLRGAPGCPRLYFSVVDVRDVADLHLRAMTHPDAAGERFIAASGPSQSMVELSRMLKARLPEIARRAPTRALPDWLVRLVARFDRRMQTVAPLLGKVRNTTSDKAQRVLGWRPRSPEDAVVATAESLVRIGAFQPR